MKFRVGLITSTVAAALSLTSARAAAPDIVIADFEGKDFGAWKSEGEAFGPGPATGAFPGQKPVSGFNGNGFANSDFKGDKGTGRLQSPEFVIERSHIRFLIGGGARFPQQTCMNLLLDGKPARNATGKFTGEGLRYAEWDVADLKGRTASIEILDTATGGGGHIMVDDIIQTDSPLREAAFEIPVTKNYLLLPIKNGGRKTSFQVMVDGVKVRALDFALAIDTKPDWWAFDDISAFRGKKLVINAGDKLPEELAERIPALFRQDDEPVAARDIYHEILRPQFHFSPMRGWTNDPNGLAYFNGEYHLFYQANPFGLDSWNKHWGHAVSPDLVHWTELPPAIRPLTGGAHSGGAFIDHGNQLGFGKGAEDTLFVSYTGVGERIAVGTGRALALTDIPGDPVLTHSGRDPKIFRYEPQNKWVMVVYEEGRPTGYAFYDSHDLKSWRRLSCIEGGNECPEFFEMQVEGELVRKWVLYGCELRAQTINGKSVMRGSKSAYMIGTFDGEKFTPETDFIRAHSGPAFYAAQTFTDAPNGRRVMIAWLEGAAFPGMPFSQAMTIPLELKLRRTSDGLRLCFSPVAELDQLHGASREGKDLTIADANALLANSSSELLDLQLEIATGNSGKFALNVRGNTIAVDTSAMEISCAGRKAKLASADRRVGLRVLVDRGALELYTDDGRTGMAFGGDIYTDNKPPQLDASPDTRVTRLRVFEMKTTWKPAKP
jgi:fructan beta-fructosidase